MDGTAAARRARSSGAGPAKPGRPCRRRRRHVPARRAARHLLPAHRLHGSGQPREHAARWRGAGTMPPGPSPRPGTAAAVLYGVACVSPPDCMAVGGTRGATARCSASAGPAGGRRPMPRAVAAGGRCRVPGRGRPVSAQRTAGGQQLLQRIGWPQPDRALERHPLVADSSADRHPARPAAARPRSAARAGGCAPTEPALPMERTMARPSPAPSRTLVRSSTAEQLERGHKFPEDHRPPLAIWTGPGLAGAVRMDTSHRECCAARRCPPGCRPDVPATAGSRRPGPPPGRCRCAGRAAGPGRPPELTEILGRGGQVHQLRACRDLAAPA